MAFEPPQYISTTAGNWLGSPYSNVWSHVGKKWMRKKAKDVNIGEQILYQKDYVKTTIKEVEPFLERSPRYAYARDELHEKNKKGEYISQLRTLLIRGLLNHPNTNNQSLEDKILKQDADFSDDEYDKMIQQLKETISSYGYDLPIDTTLKNWLIGNTITPLRPKNWFYFRALRSINSKFNDFDPDKREIGGKFHSDYLYNTVRQGIMRYLAACKNEGKGPKQQDNTETEATFESFKTKLAPEIQATMDFFMKDISKDFVTARVIDTSRIIKRRHSDYLQKNDPHITLSKGIVTEKPDIIDINEASYDEILEDRNIVLHYTEKILEKYSSTMVPKELMSKLDKAGIGTAPLSDKEYGERDFYSRKISGEETLSMLLEDSFSNIFFEYKDPIVKYGNEFFFNQTDKIDKSIREFYENFLQIMKKDVISAKIDDYFKFKKGTFMKLLEIEHEIDASLPREIYAYHQLCVDFMEIANKTILGGSLTREEMRNLNDVGRKRDNLHKKIKEEYDLDCLEGGGFNGPNYFLTRLILLDEFGVEILKDVSKIKQKVKELKEKAPMLHIFTKDEVKKYLEKYELEEIIDIRKEDFILEEENNFYTIGGNIKERTKKLEEKVSQSVKKIEDTAAREIKKIKKRVNKTVGRFKYHFQESGKRHKKLQDYLIENPNTIEEGLTFIDKEYEFDTGHRADLVYQDVNSNYLVPEVEVKANGLTGVIGLEQTCAYKEEFAIKNNLPVENVRAMLIAEEIDEETKELCKKYKSEFREIKIPKK